MLYFLNLHRRGSRIDILASKPSDGQCVAPTLRPERYLKSHISWESHTQIPFWWLFASSESQNMRLLQAMFMSDGFWSRWRILSAVSLAWLRVLPYLSTNSLLEQTPSVICLFIIFCWLSYLFSTDTPALGNCSIWYITRGGSNRCILIIVLEIHIRISCEEQPESTVNLLE